MKDREYEGDELERLHQIELSMLIEVDKLCRKHGITYFLDGGTCLGAFRHKGFIPWDDDIDIAMPLNEYHRFLEVAQKELPTGMSLHNMENTPGYYVQWTKIFRDGTLLLENDAVQTGCQQGIFIDVFPYIGLEDRGDRGFSHLRRTQFWNKLTYIYFIRRPNVLTRHKFKPALQAAWSTIRFVLRRVTSPERLRARYLKACGTASVGDYMANPAGPRPASNKMEELLPTREMVFEGHTFMGPNRPEAYLKNLYGPDYMTLPDEDKRITHAPFVLDFGDGCVDEKSDD